MRDVVAYNIQHETNQSMPNLICERNKTSPIRRFLYHFKLLVFGNCNNGIF